MRKAFIQQGCSIPRRNDKRDADIIVDGYSPRQKFNLPNTVVLLQFATQFACDAANVQTFSVGTLLLIAAVQTLQVTRMDWSRGGLYAGKESS